MLICLALHILSTQHLKYWPVLVCFSPYALVQSPAHSVPLACITDYNGLLCGHALCDTCQDMCP